MIQTNRKVSFFTLGCKLNFSETSTIARMFSERGFTKTDFHSQAEICVVNTCTVTETAEKKSRQAIHKVFKQFPDTKIIVVGCYSQLQIEEIKNIEGVTLVLGSNEKFKIFDYLDSLEKPRNENLEFISAYSSGDRTRSFLKIQDGCDYQCSYCTIPFARGKSRSDKIENIIEKVKKITENGYKEIILTGVNIGTFGQDGESFYKLVNALEEMENQFRIRISSIEPNLLLYEIIEIVANSQKFVPHFHIPLQSGSNEILRKMKRRYRCETFIDKCVNIKELMPDAFIGVDVLVGFPSESEEDFLETFNVLKSLEVSFLHIFPYSERPNTDSVNIFPKISAKESMLRCKKLQALSQQKHLEFYKKHLGTERIVLFESQRKKEKMFGFTENYIKTSIPYNEKLENQFVKVKLLSISDDFSVKVKII